jgi:hypothetical protein
VVRLARLFCVLVPVLVWGLRQVLVVQFPADACRRLVEQQ